MVYNCSHERFKLDEEKLDHAVKVYGKKLIECIESGKIPEIKFVIAVAIAAYLNPGGFKE